MSDADTDRPPTGDQNDSTSPDGQESNTGGSEPSPDTVGPENSDPGQAKERAEKRRSLSARLRRLAKKTQKSHAIEVSPNEGDGEPQKPAPPSLNLTAPANASEPTEKAEGEEHRDANEALPPPSLQDTDPSRQLPITRSPDEAHPTDENDGHDEIDEHEELDGQEYAKTDRLTSLPFDIIDRNDRFELVHDDEDDVEPSQGDEAIADTARLREETVRDITAIAGGNTADRTSPPGDDTFKEIDAIDDEDPSFDDDHDVESTQILSNIDNVVGQDSLEFRDEELEDALPQKEVPQLVSLSTLDEVEAVSSVDTDPDVPSVSPLQDAAKEDEETANAPTNAEPQPTPSSPVATAEAFDVQSSRMPQIGADSLLDTHDDLEPASEPKPPAPGPEDHTAPSPRREPSPGSTPTATDFPPVASNEPGDSDFNVHNTQMFQSRFDNQPITPRLSTREGPATGQDFLINKMRNSVGRGTNNTITVPDPSMSRKHFEIVQKPDGSHSIQDLMAVNGTALNGIDIKEADLFHGDKIEAGHSVFQFLIPGGAPVENRQRRLVPSASTKTLSARQKAGHSGGSQHPPSPPRHSLDRLLLAITIIAGLLSIPLLAFLLLSLADSSSDPEAASAYELYFRGVEAVQQQQWDQAREYFERSHAADPEFGEVQGQLTRIEREQQAGELVEKVRQELGERIDLDRLAELRAISHDSSYYDEAQSLLSLAQQEEARLLFDATQRALDAGELETAARQLAELQVIMPHHEGAQGLETDLEEALQASSQEAHEELSEEATEEEEQPPPATARRATPRPQTASPAADDPDDFLLSDPFDSSPTTPRDSGSRSAAAGINFTDGFNHYRAQRFDEAIEHFDQIAQDSSGPIADRADRTATSIRLFQSSWNTGRQALDSGDFPRAIESFESARQADQAVARSFGDEIAAFLAASLAGQGLARSRAQDYSAAADLLQRASAHDSDHRQVRSLRNELEQQANRLYLQAADLRDSDPSAAIALCRTVVTMVPPSSENHQRALNLLQNLE